jgi:hypothetical protein
MTKHLLALVAACGAALVLASACDDGTVSFEGGSGGWAGGSTCAQYTTCGECTPVDGCGWCTVGPNQGMCVSDPNECASSPAFTWTWNPDGCFVAADAGIGPSVDAGSPVVKPPTTDAAAPATDASSPVDAGNAPEAGSDAADSATASDAGDAGTPSEASAPDDASGD